MPRKASATIPGTQIPFAATPGAPAPEAPKAPPKPRMRVVQGDAIDPASRDAKKRIDARYPAVINDETVDAPPGVEAKAARYLAINAEVARLEAEKEICGNALRLAIGGNAAIENDAFRATWAERVGEIDWKELAKSYGIPDGVIEKFRKPGGRTLRVTGKEQP